MTIVGAIPEIIAGVITALLDAIPMIISTGIQLFIALIDELPTIITTIVDCIPTIISGIINAILGNLDKFIGAGVQLFMSLITNLPQIILELVKAMPQIITSLVNALLSGLGSFVDVGANLVRGLWEGIQGLADWIWDKVSSWAGDLWDGICSFFGIKSPSRKMMWVGDMLMEGLAGGIDETAGEAIDSATHMANDLNSVFDDLSADLSTSLPSDISVNASSSLANGASQQGGFILQLNITNFNNYSSEDITELTNEIMATAAAFAQRKGVVFA
jgi:phage-related protein